MRIEIKARNVEVCIEEKADNQKEVLDMIDKCKNLFDNVYDKAYPKIDYTNLIQPVKPVETRVLSVPRT